MPSSSAPLCPFWNGASAFRRRSRRNIRMKDTRSSSATGLKPSGGNVRAFSSLLILLSLTAAAADSPAPASPDGWQLVDRTEELTVYRKEVPGSSVLAYRGEAVLDAPMARIFAVIRDVER